MTAAELIEKLQKYPPDMLVTRPGYEGGLCDITYDEEIEVYLDYNTQWYYGPHEEVTIYDNTDNYKKSKVIKLS
jgi:hypothetical protein